MRYGHLIPTIYPTGVFIQSIEQTQTSTEAGGKNIITATLTNHTQQRFEILNGAKGDTGDAAIIKNITASIDNNIGTPAITMTATGAGAEKSVHFNFKNLKGEKGDITLTEEVKNYIDNRLTEVKMPLNPVCAYDMADIKKQRGEKGILIDSSGNNHHMELIGDTPVFSKDSRIINGAYFEKFSYAQCKCPVDVYNWSISMWVMPDIIQNDFHHIFFIHNLKPFFYNNIVEGYPEAFFKKKVEKGKPYHIVFTVGKDFVRVYINAKEEGCVVSSKSGLTKQELFIFGTWKEDYGFYRGFIGQVLLFDQVLTKSEIQWLYHNQYYPAKRYSLAEYKADENRALLEELKNRIPTP